MPKYSASLLGVFYGLELVGLLLIETGGDRFREQSVEQRLWVSSSQIDPAELLFQGQLS